MAFAEACNRSGQAMPYRQLMDAANALNRGGGDSQSSSSSTSSRPANSAAPPLQKSPEPILHSRQSSPRAARPTVGKQVSFAETPMEFAVKTSSSLHDEDLPADSDVQEVPWIFSLNFANVTNWWLAQMSLLSVIIALMQARQ